MKHLKPQVEFVGQKFVDDPVHVEISRMPALAVSVNAGFTGLLNARPHAFGTPGPAREPALPHNPIRPVIREQVGTERVRLNWKVPVVQPDGSVKLVPREQKRKRHQRPQAFWKHFCDQEKGLLLTGKGEPCNWCGATEATKQ